MDKKYTVLLFTLIVFLFSANAFALEGREYVDFDFDWKFKLGEFPRAYGLGFDDSQWQDINVPHDWSIEGPFGPEYASGTGYAPGGVGWYRKHFRIDESLKNKSVYIEFDGVYCNSEVFVNGQFVGRRPYGYSSFCYDITPHLLGEGKHNVIAVRVDHSKIARFAMVHRIGDIQACAITSKRQTAYRNVGYIYQNDRSR